MIARALPLLLLCACKPHHRDPDDLRGVFDRSANAAPSASAVPAKSPRPRGKSKPSASAATEPIEVLPESRRKPVAGPCVAVAGAARAPDERLAKRPACRRAEVVEDRDPDGTPRYACVFTPDQMDKRAPLPLLIFFHDEDESPAKVSRETELRALAGDTDLSGDPAHRGFLVLAPQARRIGGHVGFDLAFVSPDNADVRATLRFAAVLAARGWINRRRIYAVGDGQGGQMAALFALLQPDRVAAVACYGANAASLRWTCEGQPPPVAVLYRACDSKTACLDVEQWLEQREQTRAPFFGLRLGAGTHLEPACDLDARRCTSERGLANHRRWPRGKEKQILDYLGRFTLSDPPE